MTLPVRAAAILVLLALGAPAHAAQPGSPAPSITLPLLGDSGKKVSLGGLRGKVVYVDFWASWCIPCRISMPSLDRLQREHAGRGFVVVGVNKDVRAEDAQRFLQRMPVSFTLVSDESDAAAKAFDVKSMPSGYLVDRKGIVRHVHGGFTRSTADTLAEEVRPLLEEKP